MVSDVRRSARQPCADRRMVLEGSPVVGEQDPCGTPPDHFHILRIRKNPKPTFTLSVHRDDQPSDPLLTNVWTTGGERTAWHRRRGPAFPEPRRDHTPQRSCRAILQTSGKYCLVFNGILNRYCRSVIYSPMAIPSRRGSAPPVKLSPIAMAWSPESRDWTLDL